MSTSKKTEKEFAGLAALSICESLLISLQDSQVLSDGEVQGILEDAAAAHRQVEAGTADEAEEHRIVVAIIDRVLAGRHLARD